MNAVTQHAVPTEVAFILTTMDGGVACSSYSIVDGKTVAAPVSWVTESDMPTDSVSILTTHDHDEAADTKFTISGDDWRLLESQGLVDELAESALRGQSVEDLVFELIARANSEE